MTLFEEALKGGNIKLALFESPSNPKLHIYDIEALSKLCKKYGCLLVFDGTFCSSIFHNPVVLGADVVIHSGTKYFTGHSDTLIGFLCTNNEELYKKLISLREIMGEEANDDICKRTLQSLQTYKIRCLR